MVADGITSTIFILHLPCFNGKRKKNHFSSLGTRIFSIIRFYKRQTKGLKPIRVSIGEVSDFILKKLLFQTEETKVSL